MPSATRSARETVEQFLRATVSAAPGDMADCYAPEVVIEMLRRPSRLRRQPAAG